MKIISIDYQHDFAADGGKWYRPRPCETFIRDTLIPTLQHRKISIAEIISDYRLPRPSEREAYCVPGEQGYQSLIPNDIKSENIWIKSMNSPAWIRENGGNPDRPPGVPVCNPDAFSQWLTSVVGSPEESGEIALAGLTLDCCVLSTAQELYYRGYKARYIVEAVDSYFGTPEEKKALFHTPLSMWGQPIEFSQVIEYVESVR